MTQFHLVDKTMSDSFIIQRERESRGGDREGEWDQMIGLDDPVIHLDLMITPVHEVEFGLECGLEDTNLFCEE